MSPEAPGASDYVGLTDRQRALLCLVADGVTDRIDLAERLDISPHTVRKEVRRLCDQYGAQLRDIPALVGL